MKVKEEGVDERWSDAAAMAVIKERRSRFSKYFTNSLAKGFSESRNEEGFKREDWMKLRTAAVEYIVIKSGTFTK